MSEPKTFKIAAVTMLRDDLFYLKIWLAYYGEMLGRENCYIVNHGHSPEVAELAKGCNIIGIPGHHHKNFDMKRWRLLNNLVQGLNAYFDHVIVGDVDELVVLDPEVGRLPDWLMRQKHRQVITPLGLEVIHRIDIEEKPIENKVLGPRSHVRLAPHYSKPCILSAGVKIARGGHFTQYDQINAPEGLYLFHLKFCDFAEYARAMDRRNAITKEIGQSKKDTAIGGHWFADARGEDREVFETMGKFEMQEGFDTGPYRKAMVESFAPRGETGFYHFERPDYELQFKLPERFFGIF
ncbi:glycosyltransferase family 2 protein [uncultured Lentibacter sp.]|uniref:glycosyltransferase family 2 protein n=1 Tax=uncultured Lentibacter sp. TaxID=1659309 RepID=UPI002601D4D6|nr:glycosyltransferase family 2 protein [uncultured Lentibacter sp.]